MANLNLAEPSIVQPNLREFQVLVEEVESTLQSYPTVIDLPPGRTLFVGDLHGYIDNAQQVLKLAGKLDIDHLVFLGDYVDRGPKQLELLEFVLKLAIREPEKLIVLRGNHESEEMNKRYGFTQALREAFPNWEDYEQVFQLCLRVYEFLPLAVTTPHSIGLHGGIPEKATLEDIRLIPKPHSNLIQFERDQSLKLIRILEELQWNDPDETMREGFSPSIRGGSTKVFGREALLDFLEMAGKKRLIRSHEASRGSFSSLWNHHLIHIFSAAPYPPLPYMPVITEARYALEDHSGKVTILDNEGKSLAEIQTSQVFE
ncbi:MAG: metallophosphoesterase family protein [Promethearchaeota archaeon]